MFLDRACLHWDKVVKNTCTLTPFDGPVQILTFEGGKQLVNSLTKSLKEHSVSNIQLLEVGEERMLLVRALSRHEHILSGWLSTCHVPNPLMKSGVFSKAARTRFNQYVFLSQEFLFLIFVDSIGQI